MNTHLARIVYYVRDAGTLAEWYCSNFDLKVKFDAREEGWIEIDSGSGCTLAFHTVEDPPAARAEIAFSTSDIKTLRNKLSSRGIDIGDTVISWKHYQWCKGRDPEGNTFQIINAS